MDVKLNWKGGMTFEGAADSGFLQIMDAAESVGGNNSAASPMGYLALGLGGCTGMDVISILLKKRQAVSGFKVMVHAERAKEHPKVFTHAVIEYLVTGKDIDEPALLRAIELSAEKYCPAHAMMSKVFSIQMMYKIYNEDGKTLIKNGEYVLKPAAI